MQNEKQTKVQKAAFEFSKGLNIVIEYDGDTNTLVESIQKGEEIVGIRWKHGAKPRQFRAARRLWAALKLARLDKFNSVSLHAES